MTFNEFAEAVLAQRVKEGIRGPEKERNRFDLHVSRAAFAQTPIADIRPIDVVAWLREMAQKQAQDRRGARTLSRHTIERCYALMSVVFAEALTAGLIPSNPCAGIRQKKRADESGTREPWGFLSLDEQSAIKACVVIPEPARVLIVFAWGTGLRQGEICNLHVEDVHVDGDDPHVLVRFGSPGKPPKSGKPRRVPLFGDGLEAACRQFEIVGGLTNPNGLLFPSTTGGVRSVGKPFGRTVIVDGKHLDPFHVYTAAAGVKRIRFHDLRHTCASSLVIGCWGRAWRLEEIQPLMGHSSITITQRYAHLGEDALKAAARATATASPVTPAPTAPVFVPTGAGCLPGIFVGLIGLVRRSFQHREERAA